MQSTTIIGLGQMGATLARLLLERGAPVTVWNRTAARAAPLEALGARPAGDPAAAVAGSDVTVLCVHDARASRAILAHAGVAEVARGKLLIDLSTGSPADARALQAWAHEHGADYLDGAIQAAPEQMGRPDTTLLLSGAPEAFHRAETLLRVFGGNLKHLGPDPGAAAAMDAATLSYVYGSFLGFLYGARFAEAEGFGVDGYGRIVAEIAPSFGAFLAHEGAVIARGDYAASQSPMSISIEATARLATMARESGLASELPELVAGLFAKAARAGYGGEEAAALVKVLRALRWRPAGSAPATRIDSPAAPPRPAGPRHGRRRHAEHAPHAARHVALMREPDLDRNLTRRQVAAREQRLRALDAAPHDVRVGREPRRPLELGLEVRHAEARDRGQFAQREAPVEVSVDVLDDAAESRRRKARGGARADARRRRVVA